jgi:hypothetical protein
MLYLHLNNIIVGDMDEFSYLNRIANELNRDIFNKKLLIENKDQLDYFLTILTNYLAAIIERDLALGILYKETLDGRPLCFKLVDNKQDLERGYIQLYAN